MKINSSKLPENSVLQIRTRAGAFTHKLGEGDVLKAEVLSGEKGSVVMRAEGGQVFRARLASNVALSRGDEVFLQVTGKEEGIIYLSVRERPADIDAAKLAALVRDFEDKSLLQFAERLAGLSMPVNEDTALAMRDLMARYPEISMDEAAFIAANRLYGDEELLNAALELLSGGDKTGEMIAKLLELAGAQEAGRYGPAGDGAGTGTVAPDAGTGAVTPDAGTGAVAPDTGNGAVTPDAGTGTVAPDAGTGADGVLLTDFLALMRDAAAAAGNSALYAIAPDARIISQSGDIMQFSFASNVEENSQNVMLGLETGVQEVEKQTITADSGNARAMSGIAQSIAGAASEAEALSGGDARVAAGAAADAAGAVIVDGTTAATNTATSADAAAAATVGDAVGAATSAGAAATAATVGDAVDAVTTPDASAAATANTAAAASTAADVTVSDAAAAINPAMVYAPGVRAADGNTPLTAPDNQFSSASVVAEALSTLPEFRGTPLHALERFSDMLLRASAGSRDIKNGETDKLADLLDRLFTRIERNDANAGVRLKNAREELFARLALIEEAITKAAPPARTEMAEQTRRLMDHVRLLNNIDQFAYMQLPIMLGEQRRTAELYLFRRKGGGKKIDPDNVNILLAIDLEHMGHWEALLNIRNKDVSVRMEVPGEAEKDYFNRNTVLLHEMLSEAGFRLVSTDITYSAGEATPLTALAVLDRLSTGRIDYVV